MRNVVLTRIDDRLIHGQVVTAWVKYTNGNHIVIVDEALVKDVFLQKVLKAAAPPNIAVGVYSVKDAAAFIKDENNQDKKIIILTKSPQPIEALMEEGIELKTIVLGGMGIKTGRKKFHKNISASDEEISCMKRIIGKGSTIQIQLVPDEHPTDVSKLAVLS